MSKAIYRTILDFKTLPSVRRVLVSEPEGADKMTSKLKRNNKSFARDVYIVNEERELVFTREHFEGTPEAINEIIGSDIYFAGQGFDFIKDIFDNEGGEGEIDIILQNIETGLDEIIGQFNLYDAKFNFNEVSVSIIQNTNREKLKQKENDDVNAFNDKGFDGQEVTPCQTYNVLTLAKPVVQESIWGLQTGVNTVFLDTDDITEPFDYIAFNYYNSVEKTEIGNTLSYIQGQKSIGFGSPNEISDFVYIKAVTDLSGGIISFEDFRINLTPNDKVLSYNVKAYYSFSVGGIFDYDTKVLIHEQSETRFQEMEFVMNHTLNNVDITNSNKFYFWFEIRINTSSSLLPSIVTPTFISGKLKAKFTSTAMDSISKMVLLEDLYKHAVKSIAPEMVVSMKDYEEGGEHHLNMCANGLMLGQITSKPFTNKLKDLNNVFRETCSDIKIGENTVDIQYYTDFYKDEQIVEFDVLPDKGWVYQSNSLYNLSSAEFKFRKSSSERETNEKNTIDDVHTETQLNIPAKFAKGNLREEFSHIRSGFLFEDARKRAFDIDQSKSLENDDNLFVLKVTPMPPDKKGKFNGVLTMRINNGLLEIANNNLEGDGIKFNWGSLGLTTGGQIRIVSGEHIGLYNVTNTFNPDTPTSVLILQLISGIPSTFSGDANLVLEWSYSNVPYMTKTNEGYSLIEGIANPTNYPNLDYSIGRIKEYWYPFLATATKNLKGKKITTNSFKVNGNLKTQLTTELVPLGDSDEIDIDGIQNKKVITKMEYVKLTYPCTLEKAKKLFKDVHEKDGYGKFLITPNFYAYGYPYDIEFDWNEESITLSIEEKYITDYIEITNEIIDGKNVIFVEQVGKGKTQGVTNFILDDIWVTLYNERGVVLTTMNRYQNHKINGVLYTTPTEFSNALITLIEL